MARYRKLQYLFRGHIQAWGRGRAWRARSAMRRRTRRVKCALIPVPSTLLSKQKHLTVRVSIFGVFSPFVDVIHLQLRIPAQTATTKCPLTASGLRSHLLAACRFPAICP